MKRDERTERERALAGWLRDRAQDEQIGRGKRRDRGVSTAMARERLFLQELEESLQAVMKDGVKVPAVQKKKRQQPMKRIVNCVFSDTHFGSALDPREVPHAYGLAEEARSLASVCRQVAEYKPQYRDESELYLHVIGDIIQGQLHDMRDGRPFAEQMAIAIHLLVQAVQYLAVHYPKVTVFCTPGNHGRFKHRHPDRATNEKWDAAETVIYYAIKQAFLRHPTVQVEITRRPYYTWQAFDRRGFATHGDNVLEPGYPGRSIDVSNVRKQINEFNAGKPAGERCSLFLCGHVHTLSLVALPNETVFMSNGCLIPPDAYAQSKGMFEVTCCQWIWESVPGHIVGDARFVTIDSAARLDKSLEKIIKPFEGF